MLASMVSVGLTLTPRSKITSSPGLWQIFRKEHFFRGVDNDDQLLKILRVLGTDCFDAWLRTYGIPFETDLDSLLQVSVHMSPPFFPGLTRPSDTPNNPGRVTLIPTTTI